MRLVIINTLPKDCAEAEKAISSLIEKTSEYKIFHTEDIKIMPCMGCNDCWLKTPGAARHQSKSNTAKIIDVFCVGLSNSGNTSEIWYLSDRKQWERAKTAFAENENILFALPLYVENVPGIMLELLAGLSPKAQTGTRISFLLQGGFPEVSQDASMAVLL